jgi:AcrR family transcriptional regulator
MSPAQPSDPAPAAVRVPRRRMSADARREQLLETAREVFMRSGFGGTTVRDISDAAGVNIALLYRHFASKEELFDEAVAQPLTVALEGLVDTANAASDWAGRSDLQRQIVEEMVSNLLDAMAEITPLLGVVLFSSRGADFYTERFAPTIATIKEAADAAVPSWEHREYDTDTMSMLIVGMCFMYGVRAQFSGAPFDRDTVARELTDVIFEGLLPR